MSTYPPNIEARMSAQENMTTMLHARLEELKQDMQASFKQLADYQIKTEQKLEARFDKIETTMATKEDLAAMEARMFEALKQVVAMIDTRFPPTEEQGKV